MEERGLPENLEIAVEISKDKMEAFARLLGPVDYSISILEAFVERLKDAGVVYGIDEAAIEREVRSGEAGRSFVVARGVKPVRGDPARVELNFRPEADLKPLILEDGRVDYYNLKLVENVSKGQILARKIPATPGVPGMNVLGEVIPPLPGPDVQLRAGENVRLSDDGLTLEALIDGHPVLVGSAKVSVLPTYHVRGNVDLSTGNIEFSGNVIVSGDVTTGLEVRAGGDVEIHGTVDSALVEAGGNVVVRRGIRGGNKSQVRAGKNVWALFVENAKVEAGKSVEVGEAIMHSKVFASEKVVVRGRRGLIVGGLTKAGKEVCAKVIGSPLGTLTEVEVGVDPRLARELSQLQNLIFTKEKEFDQAQKTIEYIRKKYTGADLRGEMQRTFSDTLRRRGRIFQELKELREQKDRAEREIGDVNNAVVRVSESIYPGLKVSIGCSVRLFQEEIKRCTLRLDDELQIEIGPY